MDDESLNGVLWRDLDRKKHFPDKRPFLAHYTSLATFEKMMLNDELWLSNPLYMNDIEELWFGINLGVKEFRESIDLKKACRGSKNYKALMFNLDACFHYFEEHYVFDTYVMCFSEHDNDNTDGRLSMWRGYGGNGNGVAVVFDTSKLAYKAEFPFVLAPVIYKSREARKRWVKQLVSRLAVWLESQTITNEILSQLVSSFFERIKAFAIFSKHDGFYEECEWRYVYFKNRDQKNDFEGMLSYSLSSSSVEPKLKLKIPDMDENVPLDELISNIILGPSSSTRLHMKGIERMLNQSNKSKLTGKLLSSTIPFRS